MGNWCFQHFETKNQYHETKINLGVRLQTSKYIQILFTSSINSTCPTEDEITTYRSRLEIDAQSWVDAKKEEFDNHVTDLNYTYTHAIAQWQNRSKDYADSVNRHFINCQADRAAKIAHYETHLENKICSEKSKIKLKVEAVSNLRFCKDNIYE